MEITLSGIIAGGIALLFVLMFIELFLYGGKSQGKGSGQKQM